MHHRARAHALAYRTTSRSLVPITIPPRGGWRRDDPETGTGHPTGGTGQEGDGQEGTGAKPADPAKTPKLDGDYDPARAMRDLGKARDDAAKAKTAAAAAEKARQDLVDGIAVALGLKPDPKADPTALAQQAAKELTEVREQARELRVENALLTHAPKLSADASALADSRSFMRQLAELDPEAKDFDAQVQAAIKDAVKSNPKLAATAPQAGQGPARQGADITGSAGTRTRPAGLGAAIAARLNSSR